MDKYLVIFSSLPFVLGIAWFFFGGKKKKEEIENSFIEENIGNKEIIELNISGMHCAGCAAGIEGTLKNTEGIIEAKVNFATSKGLFKYNPSKISKEQIISKIKELGYSASEDLEDIEKKKQLTEKRLKNKVILSTFLTSIIFFLHFTHLLGNLNQYIIFILTSIVQFYIGWEFYKTSIPALKRKIADMNLLVAIGTSAAYFYSAIVLFFPDLIPKAKNTYFESAAAIITFILIGRYLETKARNKATSFMKSLLKLKPEKATILVDGKEIEIPAENIVKGDIVVLKAGDKVAVDGIIIEGGCELDQSAITGESLPVFKSENENVISGSIVKNGYCKIKATTSGADNTINQIIKLILEAQSKKPKIAKLADKIVSYFVPSILIIAIFTFDIWYFFTENITVSLIPAVSVLIIACPCALGLATPIAVVSVVGRAAKEGVLIKNPEVLEIIDKVKSVIFDKTGTLTKASLKIANYKFENPEYKDLAYNLSLKTNHPISKAIVEGLKSENNLKIENIEYIVGKGIKAYWQNRTIYLGNLSLLEENNINLPENYKDILNKEIEKGRTVIFLATNDKVLGYISLEDEIREEAKEVIKWLKENGYKVYMLTGDNEKTAKNVAKIVGIENVFSNVLPEYKLKIVKSLQEKGEKVIFVGDGINDAPSLSEADIGIAIGGKGSQLAKESGDIILLSDNLKAVIKFIKLSKIGKTTIKQNLFWAYIYNIIGIPIAAGILYPINGLLLRPIFASIAMSLSSITVVLNALRIKVIRL